MILKQIHWNLLVPEQLRIPNQWVSRASFYVKRHGAESDRNILRKVEVETITK